MVWWVTVRSKSNFCTGENASLVVQLADVDDFRACRPFMQRQIVVLVADAQGPDLRARLRIHGNPRLVRVGQARRSPARSLGSDRQNSPPREAHPDRGATAPIWCQPMPRGRGASLTGAGRARPGACVV